VGVAPRPARERGRPDHAVAVALGDAPVMRGYRGVDQIAAKTPQARQGAIFVGSSKPAVADDIGYQDRGQFPGLARGASAEAAGFVGRGGLGMAALPRCTDGRAAGRECKPGVRRSA
jgi:hypothetical protein